MHSLKQCRACERACPSPLVKLHVLLSCPSCWHILVLWHIALCSNRTPYIMFELLLHSWQAPLALARSQAVPRLQSAPARCLLTSCTCTAVVPLMLALSSHFCYERLLESCFSSYRTVRLAKRPSWCCHCFCSTERRMRALHKFRNLLPELYIFTFVLPPTIAMIACTYAVLACSAMLPLAGECELQLSCWDCSLGLQYVWHESSCCWLWTLALMVCYRWPAGLLTATFAALFVGELTICFVAQCHEHESVVFWLWPEPLSQCPAPLLGDLRHVRLFRS